MKKYILIFTVLLLSGASSFGQGAGNFWQRLSLASDHIRNNNTGNVGIGTGTASPEDKLHVIGNIRGTQFNSINGVYNTLSTANFSLQTNGITRMTLLNSNGFVGIGTTTPSQMLHVNGNALATQFMASNGIFTSASGSNLTLQTNNTTRMTILNSNGFVGIGNTNPAYALDVNGQINATGLLVNGQPLNIAESWSKTGNDLYYNLGRVGVGTTAPADVMHLSSSGNTFLRLEKSGPANEAGVSFFSGSNTLFYFWSDNADNDALKITSFGLAGESEALPRMQFPKVNKNIYMAQSGGNVGIGTASPNSKLHIVGGNVNVEGGNLSLIIQYLPFIQVQALLSLTGMCNLLTPQSSKHPQA